MTGDKFDRLAWRLEHEPERVRAEQDAELLAEHGAEWVEQHREMLALSWRYAMDLLGFEPGPEPDELR